MKRKLIWGVLWALMLLLSTVPFWATLPAPGARAITQGVHVGPDNLLTPVLLPRVSEQPGTTVHYRMSVRIDRAQRPLYLFIPLLSQRATVTLDGRLIADSSNRGVMQGLASGTTLLVLLPDDLLEARSHVLDVQLHSAGVVRGYLSPLYIGTAQELAPYYRLSVFALEYLLLMVVAAQLLMAVCVLVVWLYRPGEPLFGWLTSMLFLSMFIYVGMFNDLSGKSHALVPYATMLGSSASFILVMVTMLVSGRVPPRWLKRAVAAVPLASILFAAHGSGTPEGIFLFFNAPLNVLSVIASMAIVWRAATVHGSQDARLLLLPMCVLTLVTLHDFVIALDIRDRPVFLSLYYRPMLMVGIGMILMRRLGTSLMQLDDANDRLRRSLAQREEQLARMYEEDRRKAAAQVRHEERQRLTVDLHDGLSGHLASIIALAEREKSTAIEGTAREALDDLRLVIHSLDIDDRELRVALSGLRERLERQLRRLGIGLDWSTANLPEISGVTPTHALNVLRIVQEALTNAITHGKARRIRVFGSTTSCGRACLSVENDGIPFSPDTGSTTCSAGSSNWAGRCASNLWWRELACLCCCPCSCLPSASTEASPDSRIGRARSRYAQDTSILDASFTARDSHRCIDSACCTLPDSSPMNTMQDQGTEQRSMMGETHESSGRLRRLVRRLSRRDSISLPITLMLIGAASAAQGLSRRDGDPDESANDAPQDQGRTKVSPVEAQPGDKIAVLANGGKIAEHVLTKEEVAAGKVRIALRTNDDAEKQEAAEKVVVAQADGAGRTPGETNASAEQAEGAVTEVMAEVDGNNGGAAGAPAAQQGEDHSNLTWLFVGLGAVGVGIAAAGGGDDDKHIAPPPDDEEPPPQTQISGEVIKGYLQGAAVYLDTDHDGLPDGDPVYTDSQGRFTFTSDQTGAGLLVYGGVDTLTNVPLDGLILRAPAGATVITPLTTLIDEMLKQDDSLSVADAQSRLASALGLSLSEDVNLLTFDPLENMQSGGDAVEDHSESVLNTIGAIQALLVGAGVADAVGAAEAVITAIARTILDGDGELDLTSSADVGRVLEAAFEGTGVGVSNAADLLQLAGAVAAVNSSLIEASGLSEAALQATRYALTGFHDLMTRVGAGAQTGEHYPRDLSFSHNGDLVAAIEELASGNVADVIDRNGDASISDALRLEGHRFVFALNPELKMYEGAPDKIDTVTLKFDIQGVLVQREVRGENGEVAYQTLAPGKQGQYTLLFSELDKIFIKPPADFNGGLGATVSVHYVGLDVVESDKLNIAVTPVNDAPTGQSSTVTAEEDRPYVFTLADFPFTDAVDAAYASGANALDAVKIVSLPQAGTLFLDGKAITSQDIAGGFYVSAADIVVGLLSFVPAAGENGQGYASFQFQVRDDGGTAHGGVDLDPTARTLTVNVVADINDEPTTGNKTLAIVEDQTYTFAATDFAFADAEGHELAALIIVSLPENGALWHGDHEITLDDLIGTGYAIPAADLADGQLRFVPDADKNGSVSFDFRVQDDGGTANGGKDTSASATFTFDIAPVSDAPAAAGGAATIPDGGYYIFSAADFPFADVDEDSLAYLIIDSLPDSGALYFDGQPLAADDLGEDGYPVPAQDLADGKLTFVPEEASGGSASFSFRVQDSGTLDNGGENTSAQATFTLTMTPPLGTPTSVSLMEPDTATEKGDGNTNASSLSYRVELPAEGAYKGIVVQLFARGTDEPIAAYTLTAEDIEQGWATVQVSDALSEGTHAITARFADASDTVHSQSTAPFFTVVDRTAPGAPVLDFSSISLREDDAESGFVVSGSAEPFATVEVSIAALGHDPQVYLATVAEDGRFQVAVDPTVFGDETNITVTAVVLDRAGNVSAGDTATVTIEDALPAANVVSGTDDDEVFAGISGAAVVFEPGLNGGNDYFIGSSTAFDTVRIAGNSADYTFTLVTGDARAADSAVLQGQGHALLPDAPLYLIRSWNGEDWTEVRVQADAIQFDDAAVRLTKDGVVAGSHAGVTLHDEAGDERIVGGAGNDTLFSYDGNDWLDGGSGNDTLLSIGGHDALVGGDGDDTLVVLGDAVSAGAGNQVELFGGAGRDVFVIAPQEQFDRDVNIHDFVIGEDKIDLSWLRIMDGSTSRELTLDDLNVNQLNASLQEDGEVQIDLAQFVDADSDSPIAGLLTVTLAGGASTLTASDFILAAAQSSLQDHDLVSQAYLSSPL